MHSKDEIRRYREMGPEKRYQLFLELSAYAWHCIDADGPERAKKRWDYIRRMHDEATQRLVKKFSELP